MEIFIKPSHEYALHTLKNSTLRNINPIALILENSTNLRKVQ